MAPDGRESALRGYVTYNVPDQRSFSMKWVLIIALIVVAVFLAQKFMAGRR